MLDPKKDDTKELILFLSFPIIVAILLVYTLFIRAF